MTYSLGKKSLSRLKGVHPDMDAIVRESITRTPVDFGVHSGVRTTKEQKELFANKASKLDGVKRKSKHQKQADGFGWAVDLVPYVSGTLRWEWPLIYPIAATFSIVAQEMETTLRWGGVWDKLMRDYVTSLNIDEATLQVQKAVHEYCVRHPGPDFIDGPHYELKF